MYSTVPYETINSRKVLNSKHNFTICASWYSTSSIFRSMQRVTFTLHDPGVWYVLISKCSDGSLTYPKKLSSVPAKSTVVLCPAPCIFHPREGRRTFFFRMNDRNRIFLRVVSCARRSWRRNECHCCSGCVRQIIINNWKLKSFKLYIYWYMGPTQWIHHHMWHRVRNKWMIS